MARKTFAQRNEWSTWSKLRAKGPAKIDLCKINTDAFRHMTADQLQLAHTRAGWGQHSAAAKKRAAKADTWRKIPRQGPAINALLSNFIAALREVRDRKYLSDDHVAEYWKRFPDRPGKRVEERRAEIESVKANARADADRLERQIWDLQARAQCPIKPAEQVARDAAREGRHDAASRIRKKAVIK